MGNWYSTCADCMSKCRDCMDPLGPVMWIGWAVGLGLLGYYWFNSKHLSAAKAEAGKALREQKQAELYSTNPLEYYQFILEATQFRELLGDGWPLRIDEGAFADGAFADGGGMTKWDGVVATVLGDFNKGKTWLLGKLTEANFPAGHTVHTPGLCARSLRVAKKDMIVLDTPGRNSPVTGVTDDSLKQKRAEEGLLRDLSFDLSDAFLYVVGSVTSKEQVEMRQLARDLKKNFKGMSRVVVVHNLQHIKTALGMEQAVAELRTIYPTGCKWIRESVQIRGREETIEYLEGFDSEDGQNTCLEFQRHFILGAEHTEAGVLNDFVIERIRRMLLDVSSTRSGIDFLSAIRKATDRRLPHYVTGGRPVTQHDPAERGQTRRPGRLIARAEERGAALCPADEQQGRLELRGDMDLLGGYLGVSSGGIGQLAPYSVHESEAELVLGVELPGVPEEDVLFDVESKVGGAEVHLTITKPKAAADGQFRFHEVDGGTAVHGKINEWIQVCGNFLNSHEPDYLYKNGLLAITWKKQRYTGRKSFTITQRTPAESPRAASHSGEGARYLPSDWSPPRSMSEVESRPSLHPYPSAPTAPSRAPGVPVQESSEGNDSTRRT